MYILKEWLILNKICVYTCITGDYDKVNELSFKEKE